MKDWKKLQMLTAKHIPKDGINALIFDAPFSAEDKENLTGDQIFSNGKKLGIPITFDGKRFAYFLDLASYASLARQWGEDVHTWARKSIRLEVVKEMDVIRACPSMRNAMTTRAVEYLV